MAVELKIENSHAVTDIFGRWPSFHDAEVLSIILERNGPPCLQAKIRLFEMTSQVDPTGARVLKNQLAVTLRFVEIQGVKLDAFNHQNVLSCLRIQEVSSNELESVNFEVFFEGIFGVSAQLLCKSISVASVEPYVADEDRM